jgi:hypothetical protein
LSTGAAYTRVAGVPTEDSNLASLEAMQWVFSSTSPSVMMCVIGNMEKKNFKNLKKRPRPNKGL